MNATQFAKLIQAATGRPLTIKSCIGREFDEDEELPLESNLSVMRPFAGKKKAYAFKWKTPKKEDSLLRSFITAFCSKYQEPDIEALMASRPSTWISYQAEWENMETRWNCALWHYGRGNMLSNEKLKDQIRFNFENFDSSVARLGFYSTNYGIGIFTIYAGAWVEKSLREMRSYLEGLSLPFRNEKSEKEWVTRFVISLDKPKHEKILGGLKRH
jgi:hypothetical protein